MRAYPGKRGLFEKNAKGERRLKITFLQVFHMAKKQPTSPRAFSFCFVVKFAAFFQRAIGAVGLLRMANAAPVKYKPMVRLAPIGLGYPFF